VRATLLRMKLVGANPAPKVLGREELPSKVNYFVGHDPQQWRRNVPTYAQVKYQKVYPGVDLVYYGTQQQLEYDFVLAPGADPKAIRLAFAGADKVEVDATGDLVLHVTFGQVHQRKPRIYQEVVGASGERVRQEIPGGYVLTGEQQVGFQVAAYDAKRPLIIDPVLVYSTYLGGSSIDQRSGIALDAEGNAYVTGQTSSANFPTANARQPTYGGGIDAFVTMISGAQNVTTAVSLTRGGFRFNHGTDRYVQTVILTNTSTQAIHSPVSLVLDSLSSNATLFNRSGLTAAAAPSGSPYLNVGLGSDNVLSPGESATGVLEFTNPSNESITYDARVLAGAGSR
jgi:hypothetical protein